MAKIVGRDVIADTMWRLGFGNRFVNETWFTRCIAGRTLTYAQFRDAMKLASDAPMQKSVVKATLLEFDRMGNDLYEMLCYDCPSDRYEQLVKLHSRFNK